MKIKALGVFLALTICLLNVTLSFATSTDCLPKALEDKAVTASSVRSAMKVCVDKMNYYKNEGLSGASLGTKKFGDVVYGEDMGDRIMCIYNKSGDKLGYCEASSLVSKDALFFAEIPQQTDEAGKISKLVDLRKYILIFDAKVECDEDEVILIQYATAMKLFKAADAINKEFDCVVNVDKAYIRSSVSSSCCEIDHATGAVLSLSITKRGESSSEQIPVYESDMTQGKISKLLSDHDLVRDGEKSCFYDRDIGSYISTDHDMSSLTYTVWE